MKIVRELKSVQMITRYNSNLIVAWNAIQTFTVP